MQKTKLIHFRVSQYQYERIVNNAYSKGFKTLAKYIRDMLLRKDLLFDRRFEQMYEMIKEITNK